MSDVISAPNDNDEVAPPTPDKRRWRMRSLFQFRLRTLLIITALFAALLSWHLRKTQLQRGAVAEINKYGGWVNYDFEYPSGTVLGPNARVAGSASPYPAWLIYRLGIDFFHDVVFVNLVYDETLSVGRRDDHPGSPEILVQLDRLPATRLLLLQGRQADDEYLRHVGQLRDLEGLYMWDASHLTDAGFARLAGCTNLEEIHVDKSKITDASLAVVGRMQRMRRLTLQFHFFTDRGVVHLNGLRNLQSLCLCAPDQDGSQLTDASFRVFEQLPALTELIIQHTAISPEAVSDFEARHPRCAVISRPPTRR